MLMCWTALQSVSIVTPSCMQQGGQILGATSQYNVVNMIEFINETVTNEHYEPFKMDMAVLYFCAE